MKHYRLIYRQPHEYDDDSPSGIGDHQVGHTQQKVEFEVRTDADARIIVTNHLATGGIDFGWHLGSPKPGHYKRQFVALWEWKPDRPIKFKQGRCICGHPAVYHDRNGFCCGNPDNFKAVGPRGISDCPCRKYVVGGRAE